MFCGVVNYGEEEAAVSADAASSCRRLPSSPRLLRQPAEVVARSAGAARRRRYALKGLDHLAALDVGVEAVFEGVAPGYELEKTAQAGKTADAAEDVKRRGGVMSASDGRRRDEEEGWVGRLLEEVRREFSGLPVYVGVEEGYVKRTAPMDQRQFRKYSRRVGGLALGSTGGGRGGLSRWRS